MTDLIETWLNLYSFIVATFEKKKNLFSIKNPQNWFITVGTLKNITDIYFVGLSSDAKQGSRPCSSDTYMNIKRCKECLALLFILE